MSTDDNRNQGFIAMSCLQKAIRRGQEEEALYWALELASKAGEHLLWERLRVIASEDIGLANAGASILIHSLAESDRRFHERRAKQGGKPTYIFVSHAILYLCRSEKNREVDDFIHHLIGKIKIDKWKPDVPDYAYDKHTLEGRKKGRGFKHFYDGDKKDHSDAPTRLENVKGGSKYCESARKYDLAREKKAK